MAGTERTCLRAAAIDVRTRSGSSVSNGGNFIDRKSFHRVENQSLTSCRLRAIQCKLHQRDQLVRGCNIFWRGYPAVGDNTFLSKGFVGLVILQLGLIAGADIDVAGRGFEWNTGGPVAIAARKILKRAQSQTDNQGSSARRSGFSPSSRARATASSMTSSLLIESASSSPAASRKKAPVQ